MICLDLGAHNFLPFRYCWPAYFRIYSILLRSHRAGTMYEYDVAGLFSNDYDICISWCLIDRHGSQLGGYAFDRTGLGT